MEENKIFMPPPPKELRKKFETNTEILQKSETEKPQIQKPEFFETEQQISNPIEKQVEHVIIETPYVSNKTDESISQSKENVKTAKAGINWNFLVNCFGFIVSLGVVALLVFLLIR